MTSVRTKQELILTVCQDRGELGVAVCLAKPPVGMGINAEVVRQALGHVHSSSDVILDTQVGLTFISCEIQLDLDDADENVVNEHVLAIMHCMLSGIEDYLAGTSEKLLVPTKLAADREREFVRSLSD